MAPNEKLASNLHDPLSNLHDPLGLSRLLRVDVLENSMVRVAKKQLGRLDDSLVELAEVSATSLDEAFALLVSDRKGERELGYRMAVVDPTLLPAFNGPLFPKELRRFFLPLAQREQHLTCVCWLPLLYLSQEGVAAIAAPNEARTVSIVYAPPSLFDTFRAKFEKRAEVIVPIPNPETREVSSAAFLTGKHHLDLDGFAPSFTLKELVPVRFQKRYNVLPLYCLGDSRLTLAASKSVVEDGALCSEIASQIRDGSLEVIFVCADERQIPSIIGSGELSGINTETITRRLSEIQVSATEGLLTEEIDTEKLEQQADEDRSVTTLVKSLLVYAVAHKAADLHIAPMDGRMAIEYRIDDQKYPYPGQNEVPVKLSRAIMSQLKVRAKIDLQRMVEPQYGKFNIHPKGSGAIEVRTTIMPTIYGDAATLRFAPKEGGFPTLEQNGMGKHEIRLISDFISGAYGLMLVVGPTDSGKSTTLYSTLSMIDTNLWEVLSAEDPVERAVPGVKQTNVGGKLSYAKFLEGALRADPDYINIGETRNPETAAMLIKAAETGHIAFSTLHSHQACSTPGRMYGLGVKPYELADALSVVIAQTLLPQLCQKCLAPDTTPISDKEMKKLGIAQEWFGPQPTFLRGAGCDECRQRGTKGRKLVAEGFFVDSAIQQLLLEKAPLGAIRKAQEAQGGKTLLQHAVELAAAGKCSLQAAKSLGSGGRD